MKSSKSLRYSNESFRVQYANALKAKYVDLLQRWGDAEGATRLFCAIATEENRVLDFHCRDQDDAVVLVRRWKFFSTCVQSDRLGQIQFSWSGCVRPLPVTASSEDLVDADLLEYLDRHDPILRLDPGSYGASQLTPTASEEAVEDFIRDRKRENLIVTLTSMTTDKCLFVNQLQASDRSVWSQQDWVGIDFKTLWRDSFLPGRQPYYMQLINDVQRDRLLPEFYYQIRRPSGALAEYISTYYYLENFMGGSVRLAVSVPGAWRIVEAAPDSSETV